MIIDIIIENNSISRFIENLCRFNPDLITFAGEDDIEKNAAYGTNCMDIQSRSRSVSSPLLHLIAAVQSTTTIQLNCLPESYSKLNSKYNKPKATHDITLSLAMGSDFAHHSRRGLRIFIASATTTAAC